MAPLLFEKTTLALDTRLGNAIDNRCDRSPPLAGMHLECQKYRNRHLSALHRPTGPSSMYNCHGLTFGSRRTNITSEAALRKIIREDDYVSVQRSEVSPGDIAVYRSQAGEFEHSGIVVSVEQFGPRVLSKWGGCHEVVHVLGDCPFDASNVAYYRVTK